ncbi:MAG: DEAD/DEAH box helicase [Rhodocyclaceae bacterium]|nr:DEAD/DEAH box helicase [Rhodocyclaceae bacterium]
MVLQLDAQSLRARVPAWVFDRALDLYRRQRVLDVTLTPASASEWHLDGEVHDPGQPPVEARATLEVGSDGRLLGFSGDCSCAAGRDCRHAVAIAIKAAYKRPAAASAAPEAPAPAALPPDDRGQFAGDLFGDPAALAPRTPVSADQPVYLLADAAGHAREPGRLALAWRLSRPLRRGGWATPKLPGPDALQRVAALQPGASGGEREGVRRIQSLAQERLAGDAGPWGRVQGLAGAQALEFAAGTGRLHLAAASGQLEGRPLRWGAPRRLGWGWQPAGTETAPLWWLRPVLDGAPSTGAVRLCPGAPTLYLDTAAGQCGLVDAPGLDAAALQVLLAAQPVPASAFDSDEAQHWQRLSGMPFPAMPEPAMQWPPCVPQPVLHLAPVPASERPQRGLLVAALSFDYAGLRGHWADEQPVTRVDHGGRPMRLLRDLDAERAARRRLVSLHLLGDALGRYHHIGARTWLAWAATDWAALREAGFTIETDAALDTLFRTADALEISLDAAPPPSPGASFAAEGLHAFSLSLGVCIDGVRQDVLPWLPGLLAQARATPDGPVLPDWLWREDAHGRWLRLPSAALRPWLGALLALMEDRPAADWDGPHLPLSRGEALGLGAALAGTPPPPHPASSPMAMLPALRALTGAQPLPAIAAPAGLQATLRPYQQHGLAWLQHLRAHGLGGVLADDMGLGKTLQTLAHLLREKEDGRLDAPCLVVAPVSLLSNWRREAARFAPALRTRVWHGATRRGGAFAEDCDLVIAPYSLLQRDRARWLGRRWHIVVLDEAQHIKNARSQAAQVVAALDARQRLALSGTPMENHLGELWSLFDFLMPGFLGSAARFRARFRTPIEKLGDGSRLAQLRRRVAPFILRRTQAVVAGELPERIESTVPVTLEGAQADLYETIRLGSERAVRDALAGRGLGGAQIQVLDALLKLRQVCCDPRLLPASSPGAAEAPSAKLALLMELLHESQAEGRRVLVFSQFTRMLALIEDALHAAGLAWTTLTGDTRDRDAAIARFTEGEVPIFLISLKAGGTGLNLPQADTVIHYDPWWNPAAEAQATARAHRLGQTKQVLVYRLVAEGTIEERILALQARKAALAQGLLHGVVPREAPLFTEDDVTDLLRPLG